MNTYLVTGVAGFIGAEVAKYLLSNGNKVIGLDNLSTGYIEHVPNGVEFYEIGVHEPKVIDILKKYHFEMIFHIAGQSGGELSYADPVYDLQANTQSTLLLLRYAVENNCKKFIYASTVSVYGDYIKENITEDMLIKPKSFYGVGKAASESYLRIYAEQFGLDTIALRLFNVYGPGQNLKNLQQGIVSIFLSQALNNKHIHIKGSKDRFRDIIHIDDVVNAFITVMNEKFKGYNFYNVCTGKKTLVGDLIKIIRQNLPFDVSYKYEGSTPGDVFGYTGSPNKLINQSNWMPKIDLDYGIKEMIKWALSNHM